MKKLLALLIVCGMLFSSTAFAGEGHDAGREWAERHGITDTSYNNGNSNSFNEGVREYAEQQQQENSRDY